MKARHLGCSLATLSALVVLLAGCGPDEPGAEPSESPSSATTGPTEPTEPTSPTETTSAVPASGPLLRGDGVSVNAPEGWQLDEQVVDFLVSANAPDSTNLLTLASSDSIGEPRSLQEQAESIIEVGGWVQDPEILPPVTVGGVEMYHVAGPIDAGTELEMIGTVHEGHQVEITLTFERGSTSPAEQRRLTESVWASVAWA